MSAFRVWKLRVEVLTEKVRENVTRPVNRARSVVEQWKELWTLQARLAQAQEDFDLLSKKFQLPFDLPDNFESLPPEKFAQVCDSIRIDQLSKILWDDSPPSLHQPPVHFEGGKRILHPSRQPAVVLTEDKHGNILYSKGKWLKDSVKPEDA